MTRTALAAVAALSALTLASILIPVQGHASPEHQARIQVQRPWRKVLPLVEYNRDDIRDALRELIGNVGLSYTIDPDVQGPVSLSLHEVTFESALGNVLRQANADYRIEGSVIHVFRRTALTPVPPPPVVTGPELVDDSNGAASRDTVVLQDPSFLYVFRGNRVFKLQKHDLKVVAAGMVPK